MIFPIGIDFGTTNTVLYYYDYTADKFNVIPNHLGEGITPTVVYFGKDIIKFGKEAAKEGDLHPENTIFDIKRMIGKSFNDKDFKEDMKNWPFKVVCGKHNLIYLEVDFYGKKKLITPEEVAMHFFRYIFRCVKKYFEKKGFHVADDEFKAVITVPAHFSNSQRANTELAARQGGFKVLRIIDEPSSAGISLWYDNEKSNRNALVFDLGGGTFDVSLIEMKDGNVKVINKEGDPHLGGHDLDYEILNILVRDFKYKTKIDLTEDKPEYRKALKVLKSYAEQTKKIFNTSKVHTVDIENLVGEYNLNCTIRIENYEFFIRKYMERCKKLIEKLFEEQNIEIEDFEGDVILVGGSSRIRSIQNMLSDVFRRTKARIFAPKNQDECVALGAAIMCKSIIDKDTKIVLSEKNSNTIGVKVKGNKMEPILPRMSPYGTKKTKEFSTIKDNQKKIKIAVYEGEDVENVLNNNFLGSYEISVPKRKAKEVTAKISLKINESGILVCTAKTLDEEGNEKEETYNIKGDRFDCHKSLILEAGERISYENEIDNKKDKIEKLIEKIEGLADVIKKRNKKEAKQIKDWTDYINYEPMELDEKIRLLEDKLKELKKSLKGLKNK